MTTITRRLFGLAVAAGLAFAALPSQAADKEVRVGFQKYGTLVLIKSKGLLEQKLAPLGYTRELVRVRRRPADARGAERRRHRHRPDRRGAADLRPGRQRPAGLRRPRAAGAARRGDPGARRTARSSRSPTSRARQIGLNKGSNVHFLLVKALAIRRHRLRRDRPPPSCRRPTPAPPSASGAIDAWAIWDPFQASAEQTLGARVLTDAEGLAPNYQFYLGERGFVAANPEVVDGADRHHPGGQPLDHRQPRRGRRRARPLDRHPGRRAGARDHPPELRRRAAHRRGGRRPADRRRHLRESRPAAEADRHPRRGRQRLLSEPAGRSPRGAPGLKSSGWFQDAFKMLSRRRSDCSFDRLVRPDAPDRRPRQPALDPAGGDLAPGARAGLEPPDHPRLRHRPHRRPLGRPGPERHRRRRPCTSAVRTPESSACAPSRRRRRRRAPAATGRTRR